MPRFATVTVPIAAAGLAIAVAAAAASACGCTRPPGPLGPNAGLGADDATDRHAADGAAAPADVPQASGDAGTAAPPEPLPPGLAGDDTHPVRIFFDEGKSEMKEIARPVLDTVAERLRLRPDEVLRLVAHTDDRERLGRSLDLARERAAAVRRYLEERGVDTVRFIVDARGEYEPLGDNSTDEGRAANRRVDFVFERGR